MIGFDKVFYIFLVEYGEATKVGDGSAILAVSISCFAPEDDVLKLCFQIFPQLFNIHILRFLILLFL